MTEAWEYRSLDQNADIEQVVDLEIAVWRLVARDAVPSSILHALVHSGSLLVGCYDGDRLIGMALAFPGRAASKKWILWSHMAAVHPDYQGQGVGFGLKQFQRRWALEQGYSSIAWTFDPLQPGNANFNLHRLGAISNIYHVNFYGEMTDGINAGLPSDRLEVIWNLRSPRVKSLAVKGRSTGVSDEVEPLGTLLLRMGDNSQPVTNLSFDGALTAYCAEIPINLADLRKLQPELAFVWRVALRNVLSNAFLRGFTASDFVSSNGRCWYVLTASKPWFLYVVECSDRSLYTGVTPDLERRVKLHNAGRGAAYTASRRPVHLVAAWNFSDRVAASQAEIMFKRLSRQAKLSLINDRASYLGMPFVGLR